MKLLVVIVVLVGAAIASDVKDAGYAKKTEYQVETSYKADGYKGDGYANKGYGYEQNSYGRKGGYKQAYHGKYPGKCGADGFYYNDGYSFVVCSNGNGYVQACAPGSRNSGYGNYQYGNDYHTNDFCDVNLVDYGYGAAKGYGYGAANYGGYGAAPYGGYGYGDGYYGRGDYGYQGYNRGYGYRY